MTLFKVVTFTLFGFISQSIGAELAAQECNCDPNTYKQFYYLKDNICYLQSCTGGNCEPYIIPGPPKEEISKLIKTEAVPRQKCDHVPGSFEAWNQMQILSGQRALCSCSTGVDKTERQWNENDSTCSQWTCNAGSCEPYCHGSPQNPRCEDGVGKWSQLTNITSRDDCLATP